MRQIKYVCKVEQPEKDGFENIDVSQNFKRIKESGFVYPRMCKRHALDIYGVIEIP